MVYLSRSGQQQQSSLPLEDWLSWSLEQVPMSQEHATLTPQYWSVTIADLGEEELRLRFPIVVMLETHAQRMIASWPEVDVSATGDNAAEAIDRLKSAIVARYRELQQTERPKKFWRYWRALCAVIEESEPERQLGSFSGSMRIPNNFNDPLPDELLEAFER
jgi:hypothetical protein